MKIPPEFLKLKRLFSRTDKFRILMLFTMMLFSGIFEVVGVGMVPAFIAIVGDPTRVLRYEKLAPIFESLNIVDNRTLLIYGALLLVAIFIFKNSFLLFLKYFESRFIYNRRYLFSIRLMRAYMQAPYTFYLQRNTSELLRNSTSEVNILINNVLGPTLKILKDSILALSIVVFLFFVEPVITMFVAVFMGGAAAIFLFLTQKKMKQYGEQEQEYRKQMLKAARQGFGGIKDARVLNREEDFIEAFREMAFKSSRLQMLRTFISNIPRPVIESIAVISIIIIALVMVLQDRPIADIVPIIALFGIAIVRIMPAIQQITQMVTELRYHIVSVNPVYDDLEELKNAQREFKADRKKNEKTTFNNSIEIKDLYYNYPNSEEQALKGVSLEIQQGKAVAFVGSSGAGKTTIADVILGLLEPQQGDILVDGTSIFSSISAWQRNIGYIPQFIYLSDDTLRRNIAFGLPDSRIDEEKILKAVELAQLRELVDRLPDGLDTRVGERGTRFSGGQRQRVGIARALYHDPQVLVMDEATSALDNITEGHIIEAIEALKGDRTIIMIAHRLTTVINCDSLIFMENGVVIDKGSYEELLKRNEKFRKMAKED